MAALQGFPMFIKASKGKWTSRQATNYDFHKESNRKKMTSRQATKSLNSGLRLPGSKTYDFHKESDRNMTTSRQATKSLESGLRPPVSDTGGCPTRKFEIQE